MSLKFYEIKIDKKEFPKSKQPIDLNLVDANKIVISDRLKHTDDGFKHFIGCQEDNIIRPLCIILPQMSGYRKYFENGGKKCLSSLKMTVYLLNIMKFGTKLIKRD